MNDTFDVHGYLSDESERFRIEQRERTPGEFAQVKRTVASALAQFHSIGPGHATPGVEAAYRGLGIGGAHATLRSLDGYHTVQSDGSFDLIAEPDSERVAWILSLVDTCMQCGMLRLREIDFGSPMAADHPSSP